jgi:hypothetical protein
MVSGYLSHFWDNKEYIFLTNTFLERLSNLLSQYISEEKYSNMFNYILHKYYDYDMNFNTNNKDRESKACFYKKREVIEKFLELFNKSKNKYKIDNDLRIGSALILKNLYHINYL